MDSFSDTRLHRYARTLARHALAGECVGCNTLYTHPENAERFVMQLLIAVRDLHQEERSKGLDDDEE